MFGVCCCPLLQFVFCVCFVLVFGVCVCHFWLLVVMQEICCYRLLQAFAGRLRLPQLDTGCCSLLGTCYTLLLLAIDCLASPFLLPLRQGRGRAITDVAVHVWVSNSTAHFFFPSATNAL